MTPGKSLRGSGDVERVCWLVACCGPMLEADDGLTST
jgi:hypothetical protein